MTAVEIIFQKIKSNSLPDNKTISLMPVEYENSDDVGLYFHEVFKEKDIRIYYHDKGPTGPSSTYSESGEDVASKVGSGRGYRGRGYHRGGGRGGGNYRGGRQDGCRRGGYNHRGGRRGGGGARYRDGGYYRGGRNYDRAIFIY
ncbi:H/ACA ribonucleoprotein complex subunit 1-like [Ctenocephalides felis]|uniref:H/ACA ribonucleoprotein complex subunit 1-like n=1 Tax=Ctenocephalides felis TaxID=7515 RepID=UPI000E6E1F9B|nr:H/ACA ribonucleoprotein complex subunit 1-like [Ctenocephalides felis]